MPKSLPLRIDPVPAPIPGETKRQREKRDRLFHTLLDLSGVPR